MSARIYQPAKTAMSSGMANTKQWVLEFAAEGARRKDNFTGWNSIEGTANQVKLKFETLEEAQSYAAANGIAARIDMPHPRKRRVKAYSDNFKHDRVEKI
jgi:hypothetical protein